ncbi:MAG: sigma-70 family RNA polymerase sigma factor [Caldilineaceae bacterium]|nr:sigma-70 family RNA polymerase sigma factor [Caldilineaceae bacterium]
MVISDFIRFDRRGATVATAPVVETEQPATLISEESPEQEPAIAEEAILVAQAKDDPAAFGILYERYIDRVYAYIYHRVGNAQDTEDLTARTFYRALDKLHTYEDRGLPFSAWLFRIAHNLVANWHRDRSRRRFLSLDKLWSHSSETDRPEEQVEEEERHEALWDAINELPDDRRNLLLYKFSSRLSNLEIGEMMNKSESAIKSLYFRTLATLRKELEAKGWGTQTEMDEADVVQEV